MKFIVVARHFPPEVSGGVRRWYYLSKALAQRGHHVTIVAPDLGQNYEQDVSLAPLKIVRVPHEAAINGLKARSAKTDGEDGGKENPVKSYLREALRLPDADISWAKALSVALPRILKDQDFDWIITSSPSESMHYVGYKLQGTLAKYWHADFRDSWLEYPLIEARAKPLRRWRESRMAQRWLSQADILTAVDTRMSEEVSGLSGKYCQLVPHFAPPANSTSQSFEFQGSPTSTRLVYTGSFTLSDRNRPIAPLLRDFEVANINAPNLSLHILGRLTDDEIHDIHSSTAHERIFIYGALSTQEALAAQKLCDALLITASLTATAIPGKLVEYRQTGKPIIAVGEGPWLEANDDLNVGHMAMAQAAKGELSNNHQKPVNIVDVCDQLEAFYNGK